MLGPDIAGPGGKQQVLLRVPSDRRRSEDGIQRTLEGREFHRFSAEGKVLLFLLGSGGVYSVYMLCILMSSLSVNSVCDHSRARTLDHRNPKTHLFYNPPLFKGRHTHTHTPHTTSIYMYIYSAPRTHQIETARDRCRIVVFKEIAHMHISETDALQAKRDETRRDLNRCPSMRRV